MKNAYKLLGAFVMTPVLLGNAVVMADSDKQHTITGEVKKIEYPGNLQKSSKEGGTGTGLFPIGKDKTHEE